MEQAFVERERIRRSDLWSGGAAAGVLAGAAMLVWVTVSAALAGVPASQPLEMVAATFALEGGGPGALLVGVVVWVAASAALALPFAALVPRDFPLVCSVVIGVAYSFVAMVIITTVVLPLVNPAMRAEMTASGGAWVLAYVVFGIGLGFVPKARRLLAR